MSVKLGENSSFESIVCVLVTQSCPTLATPWGAACQAPPSMGFSRQECWSELTLSSPGDLPDPGIESGSPALQADSSPYEPPRKILGRLLNN